MLEYDQPEESGAQTDQEEQHDAPKEVRSDEVSQYDREQDEDVLPQQEYPQGGNMKELSRSERLLALREQLLELKIEKKGDKAARLQADITALNAASQKIDGATEPYAAGYDNLLQQVGSLKTYAKQKMGLVEDATDSKIRGDIETKVEELVDGRLEGWKKERDELEATSSLKLVDDLPGSVQHAQVQFETAQKRLEQQKQAFDKLVNLQSSISDKLKAAQDLKKAIEAEEERSEPEKWYVMYFHLKELQTQLAELRGDEGEDGGILNTYDPDGYEEALEEAWGELYSAHNGLREAEMTLNDKRSRLTVLTENIDEFSSNRQQYLLEVIGSMV